MDIDVLPSSQATELDPELESEVEPELEPESEPKIEFEHSPEQDHELHQQMEEDFHPERETEQDLELDSEPPLEAEPEPHHEPVHESQPEPEPEPVNLVQRHEESTLLAEASHEESPSVARRITEDSFHSAREVAVSKENTVEPMEFEYSQPAQPQISKHPTYPTIPATRDETPVRSQPPQSQFSSEQPAESKDHDTMLDQFDDIGSPSEKSTPDRPLIRKSSLTFASLPAREPLTKMSMGGTRMSRISQIDPSKSGYFGRQTGGARMTQFLTEEKTKLPYSSEGMDEAPMAPRNEDSDLDTRATKMHNKSSTQLLHEKINMLGKAPSTRGTKSIVSLAAQQVAYPELPAAQQELPNDAPKTAVREKASNANESSKPPSSPFIVRQSHFARERSVEVSERPRSVMASTQDPHARFKSLRMGTPERRSPASRPFISHGKSASVSSIMGSPRPGTAGSLYKSATIDGTPKSSTTPVSSPKRYEGPLSASKSKLQSIMKTAKGLFSSSGTASAAAKEVMSPGAGRSKDSAYPSLFSQSVSAAGSPVPHEGRRTRSFTEREAEKRREQELKDRQRLEEQLEKAREAENAKPSRLKPAKKPITQRLDIVVPPPTASTTKSSPQKLQPPSKLTLKESETRHDDESKFTITSLPQPQPKKNERRPIKPTREVQKPKPQPVAIKIGTLSQRIPLASAPPSATTIPEPQPTPLTKQPSVKKPSIAASQISTTSSFKSSTTASSTKTKAALAAERREQVSSPFLLPDQVANAQKQRREAQQRREAERKLQEETRRQEQLRAETERRERERLVTEDPKSAAKKQAIEKRRLENARKAQQQRSQQPTPVNDAVCKVVIFCPCLANIVCRLYLRFKIKVISRTLSGATWARLDPSLE